MGDLKKKLACLAMFIIVVAEICTIWFVVKPFLLHLPNPSTLTSDDLFPIISNFSNSRSEVYELEGDIRIDGASSSIFIASSRMKSSWTVRPYPKKLNTLKYRRVTNFQVKLEAPERMPHCHQNITNIPAIIFSSKGHVANTYHAFSDLLFPLFSTSHHLNRTSIFLITNHHPPWISKYKPILEKLSKYDFVDIDKQTDVLCFSKMTVGLKSPDYPFIHPTESVNFPICGFREFLRGVYALERVWVQNRTSPTPKRPRMLIVSREKSRHLLNEGEVANLSRGIGFEVVVEKLVSDVNAVAKLVNSFDVLLGVHGAGITNMVFLPEEAVVIQINPYGADWEGMLCFGYAAQSMKLKYLEYQVSLNESSLQGKYDDDVEVYNDPGSIRLKNNGKFHYVYLDLQNVTIDLHRFRNTLLTAFHLLST